MGTAEQILVERVAVKIGMIIRRATLVVAGRSSYDDAKERNAMAPLSVARGVPQSGDRAAAGMPDRAKVHVGRQ